MEQELISVIVPVYKVEKYLRKCIDSIINQTYKNLEIILVDDGSPDNCPAICDEYAKKDNRIKVIHKENGGVSSARNAGVDCATGKYVSFVDADDVISLKMYELLSTCFKENPDIITFNYCKEINLLDSTKKSIEKRNKRELYESFIDNDSLGGYIWNKLYKNSIIQMYGIRFDTKTKIMEDALFGFSFLQYTKRGIHFNDYLYFYRQVESSALHTASPYTNFQTLQRIVELIEKFDLSLSVPIKIQFIEEGLKCRAVHIEPDMSLDALKCTLKRYVKDIKNANTVDCKRLIKLLVIFTFPGIYRFYYRINYLKG